MTPLSVSFKATLKTMNTIKFQILVLLQKKGRTLLFPNNLQVNTLSHLCMNHFNIRAYCRLGKSEIAIFFLHFGPKTAKI